MSFSVENGHIVAVENGRVALTTEAPMMNLIPDAAINLTDFEIEFPNFWFGVGYYQNTTTVGSQELEGCTTFTALVEQEWGPGLEYDIPNIVLGTVPVGTDYLDVRINLERIVTPFPILNVSFVTAIPENVWVKLEGGSCIPEKQSGIARLFEIVLIGTDIVLRRYQSVQSGGSFTRLNPSSGGPGERSYFYAGTGAPNSGTLRSIFGTVIQNKSGYVQSYRPPGKQSGLPNNNPCSLSSGSITYRSVFKGSIRIVPGRISG